MILNGNCMHWALPGHGSSTRAVLSCRGRGRGLFFLNDTIFSETRNEEGLFSSCKTFLLPKNFT
jgi:hypothetical protein